VFSKKSFSQFFSEKTAESRKKSFIERKFYWKKTFLKSSKFWTRT
jgi:hypothetical protein